MSKNAPKISREINFHEFPQLKPTWLSTRKTNVALLQTTGFLTKETDESFCPFMLDFTLLLSSPF